MKNICLKTICHYFLLSFVFYACHTPEKPTEKTENSRYDKFSLTYTAAGLGSGMGNMMPSLQVFGTKYYYQLAQNSFYGDSPKQPTPHGEGNIRSTSIDSIIDIIKNIKQKNIDKTNINTMSGTLTNINIKYDELQVNFKLHNASDSAAQKIIDILNSNFPAETKKLQL
jgi:hypothetical protein